MNRKLVHTNKRREPSKTKWENSTDDREINHKLKAIDLQIFKRKKGREITDITIIPPKLRTIQNKTTNREINEANEMYQDIQRSTAKTTRWEIDESIKTIGRSIRHNRSDRWQSTLRGITQKKYVYIETNKTVYTWNLSNWTVYSTQIVFSNPRSGATSTHKRRPLQHTYTGIQP